MSRTGKRKKNLYQKFGAESKARKARKKRLGARRTRPRNRAGAEEWVSNLMEHGTRTAGRDDDSRAGPG